MKRSCIANGRSSFLNDVLRVDQYCGPCTATYNAGALDDGEALNFVYEVKRH